MYILRSFIVSDYIQLYEIHFAKFVYGTTYTLRTLSFFCRFLAFEYLSKINWIYLSTEMSLFLDCLCCSIDLFVNIGTNTTLSLFLYYYSFILTLEIRKNNSSNFFFFKQFWLFQLFCIPSFKKKKKFISFYKKKVPAKILPWNCIEST